jgi:hypothetical protein
VLGGVPRQRCGVDRREVPHDLIALVIVAAIPVERPPLR